MTVLNLTETALDILEREQKLIESFPRDARGWTCPYCKRTYRWPRTHVKKLHRAAIRSQVVEDWKKRGGDPITEARLSD